MGRIVRKPDLCASPGLGNQEVKKVVPLLSAFLIFCTLRQHCDLLKPGLLFLNALLSLFP